MSSWRVRVARNRQPGVHLGQMASDFGISEWCLTNGLPAADREDCPRLGDSQSARGRQPTKRIRLVEQEYEVLRRGGGVPVQANYGLRAAALWLTLTTGVPAVPEA